MIQARVITYDIAKVNYFYGPPSKPEADYQLKGFMFENGLVKIDQPTKSDRWYTDEEEFDGGSDIVVTHRTADSEIPVDVGDTVYSLLQNYNEYGFDSGVNEQFLELLESVNDNSMLKVRPVIYRISKNGVSKDVRGIVFDHHMAMIESDGPADIWLCAVKDYDPGTWAIEQVIIDDDDTALMPCMYAAICLLKRYRALGFDNEINAKAAELFSELVIQRYSASDLT